MRAGIVPDEPLAEWGGTGDRVQGYFSGLMEVSFLWRSFRLFYLHNSMEGTCMRYEYKPVMIEVLGKKFEITPIFEGESKGLQTFEQIHYIYTIKVRRLDVPGEELSFTFHNSHMAWREGRKRLTKEEAILAFRSYLEDAIVYLENENIDSFAKEFGYLDAICEGKMSIKELIETYKACEKAYFDFREKLKLSDDDLFDIVNYLIELENDDRLTDVVVRA